MADKRYVVYVQPAKQNLEALDGSLESRIRSECEAFLDAWDPSMVFEKGVLPPVKQIKKDRSVVRAFGAHWIGYEAEILLVVAVYKKGDENQFWARDGEFRKTVIDYFEVLDELDENNEISEWIHRAKNSDDFRVYESA
ncbi:hypothetical protein [Halosimplex amylolyticum]|uniref:hypothetical protein n=1 Tax=Halosimplex amylolyticum TaxID=3396616 RepID=UPI003F5634E5